jgi:uncharacterized protein (TIGR03437 family)
MTLFAISKNSFARLLILGLGCTSIGLFGAPVIQALTNSVDYGPRITVNGFVFVFGSGFSPDGPHSAASVPPPVKLGAVSVFLCDAANPSTCEPERLLYVDRNQINFLTGNPAYSSAIVKVVVDQSGTTNSGAAIKLLPFAPAIFVEGTDCLIDPRFTNRDAQCGLTALPRTGTLPSASRGAITGLDGQLVQASNPLHPSSYFTVWAGGLGVFRNGAPPASLRLKLDGAPIYIQSGALTFLSLTPVYVGETEAFPGLYQLNFQVPEGILPFPCEDYDWEFQGALTEGDSPTSQPVDLPVTLSAANPHCLQPVAVPDYSSPITTTLEPRGGTTMLTGSTLILMTDPAFRYSRATMALAGAQFPPQFLFPSFSSGSEL